MLGKFVAYLVLTEEYYASGLHKEIVGYLELVLSETLSPRSWNCSMIPLAVSKVTWVGHQLVQH